MNNETFSFLLTWTPYLLTGCLWNILIAILAVAIGTSFGTLLAWIRIKKTGKLLWAAEFLTKFYCNIPTLAFMFYAAYILPKEITIPGTEWVVVIPYWLKAALGLSASTTGFTSESLTVAYRAWDRGDYNAALLFIPTWANSSTISFVASSTASLVGVSELISRCNYLIAATGTSVMVPLYLYCGAYFIATCLLWAHCIKKLKESNYVLALPARLAAARWGKAPIFMPQSDAPAADVNIG